MSNTPVAVTRFRMLASTEARMLAGTCASMAHTAAASAYKPFIDARNDVQGGADAWGPPV
jgi:hypothetical protein